MTTTLAPAPTQAPPEPRRRRGGWRVPLRIARREAWRAKGRSALVVALVMLPVLVVTLASTLLRTSLLTPVEALPRQLGSADANVKLADWEPAPGNSLVQTPDTNNIGETDAMTAATDGLTGAEAIGAVLGEGTRIIELPSQEAYLRVGERSAFLQITEAPLSDPMLQGMVELRQGRLPTGPGEVAVTEPLAGLGAAIGTTQDLGTYGQAEVVGVVRSARTVYEAWAAPGGVGVPFTSDVGSWHSQWLVTTPGGVAWEDVLQLNRHGLYSLSRAVVEAPPTDDELAADPRTASLVASEGDEDATMLAVGGLLVVMVLLEVVLLAGPAFAVGASRQTRSLGLLAAQGATRPHLRRVVMAQAVVLGGVAAALGVVLGVLTVWLAYPWLLPASNGSLGPFEFAVSDLAIVAVFGFVSALLAALLPARAAARLDPVRALAGRRPSARRMRWHAPLGLALVAAGAGAAFVSTRGGQAPLLLALSALLVVIGAVMLTPLAIAALARATGRAGFAGRYATRDMARNQLRTAPAVAAVTAVVAGAVALGILGASDSAQSRAMYVPSGPAGDAMGSVYWEEMGPVPSEVWEALRAALVANTPDSTGTLIQAAPDLWSGGVAPGTPALTLHHDEYVDTWTGPWAGYLLIGQGGLDLIAELLTREQLAQGRAALDAGTAVQLTTTAPDPDPTLRIDKVVLHEDSQEQVLQSYTVPAISLQLPGVATPAMAILPTDFIAETGVAPVVSGIRVDATRDLDAEDERELQQVAAAVDERFPGYHSSVLVETGWRNQDWVLLLILGAAAAALAIGGSLTAAKLALSDARADFATLGAVGAPPSVRRRIAGMYGAAIALLGAGLGATVGFIPGIAACFPLTSQTWMQGMDLVDTQGNALPDVFIVIPWALVGALVLGLPLLVGLVVMLTTRSRLPMVQRIE